MEDQSYIKLFRKMLDWEWWDDRNVRDLFFTMLLMANWKEKQWKGISIERGSFFTSLEHLSQKSGLSVRQVRTALNKLKSTGEVTSKTTNCGTLVTIANWGVYQGGSEKATSDMTSELTAERQTDDKRMTSERQQLKNNKNIKKGKNDKKDIGESYSSGSKRFTPPTIEEVSAYIREQGYHIDAEMFIDHYEANGWMVGKNKMKDYKATLRNWERRRQNNAGEIQPSSNKQSTPQQGSRRALFARLYEEHKDDL